MIVAPLVFLTFIELFVAVFNLLIIIRILLGYLVSPANGVYANVVGITEPLLGPIRKFLPLTPGIDLAPLVTFFLLEGIQYAVGRLLGS
jgi:uncharacterized protein YggT (Ycf19 family)